MRSRTVAGLSATVVLTICAAMPVSAANAFEPEPAPTLTLHGSETVARGSARVRVTYRLGVSAPQKIPGLQQPGEAVFSMPLPTATTTLIVKGVKGEAKVRGHANLGALYSPSSVICRLIQAGQLGGGALLAVSGRGIPDGSCMTILLTSTVRSTTITPSTTARGITRTAAAYTVAAPLAQESAVQDALQHPANLILFSGDLLPHSRVIAGGKLRGTGSCDHFHVASSDGDGANLTALAAQHPIYCG